MGGKGSERGKCDGNDSLRSGEREKRKVCMKVGEMEFSEGRGRVFLGFCFSLNNVECME